MQVHSAVAATPPAGAPRIVTKADYARARGCSAAYVSKLIRLGKLTAPALLPNGRIDRLKADAQLASQQERVYDDDDAPPPVTVATTPGPAEDDDSLVELRKAVERERQRKLARENDEAEGQLIPREAVEREQETAARETRDAMLRVPHRVADRLAREADPAAIVAILRQAIEQALEDAVRDHEAAAAEDDDAGPGDDDRP